MLKTTKLYRYITTGDDYIGKSIRLPFIDEYGKITEAYYKLVKVIAGPLKNHYNYKFKLDARSVRYMRRVKIIENS
jgi:hypothetical protein